MKMNKAFTTAVAASAALLTAGGALAQNQGSGQGGSGMSQADDQRIQQEQAQKQGAQLTVSPATVREIKQALNKAGYDPGDVDGQWNKNAQTAVRNYQQAIGLEPTGQLNLATLKSLGINVFAVAGGGQGQGQGQTAQEQAQGQGQGQGQQGGQEQAQGEFFGEGNEGGNQ